MKTAKFLLALFSISLVLSSCYTTESLSSDNMSDGNTRRIGNRVYVDDPYYGQVVLERDPYSGRYYDVTNGGIGGWRSPYNRFGGYGPVYREPYRGGRPVIVRPQTNRQLPPPQRAIPQRSDAGSSNSPQRQEARKQVLGERRN